MRRVAKPTAQIAAASANKDAVGTGQETFALCRLVNFRDFQHTTHIERFDTGRLSGSGFSVQVSGKDSGVFDGFECNACVDSVAA